MASPSLDEIRDMQRARGTAAVLAIATVVPPYAVDQAVYAEYYFQVTGSEHMTELKRKFKNICDKSGIKKRHFCLTKEILERNPEVIPFDALSLDIRRDLVVEEIPRLGSEAAEKAIREWGRPKSDITHLICVSTCGFDLPGMDFEIIKLLGLRPTVRRHLMYYQGCFAGGMVMRLAKDLAENNKGARVLVVSAETITSFFRGPSLDKAHFSNLIGQAILGDGAAAIVVGSDPIGPVEKPIFEIVRTTQTLIPACEDRIVGRLTGTGLVYQLGRDVADIIAKNMEGCLLEAFSEPLPSIRDWNSIFWIVHPGGPAILDKLEEGLDLEKGKLRASRHVLGEYGNMSSCTVMFVMDEMRRRSTAEGARTTGEGLEWGVLLGLGPGLTVDTVVLRAVECAHV